jgi:dsDNA-specific endonuclease/ATPase MutS2
VDRIFVIHGVGEGKLRDVISTQLMQMTEVKSFKNEFHPRYGFGATEVIF